MSSNSDVIKEFLVSLGYKVDANALAKFKGGLADATAAALKVGAAATASAVAVEEMVKSISYDMTNLYYASQLTGASATNITSIGNALERSGSSGDEAAAAVKRLKMALAGNPGKEAWLHGLIGDPEGKITDTGDQLLALVKKLKEMPLYAAIPIASQFGMGPEDLMYLENNLEKITHDADEYKKHLHDAGVELDGPGGLTALSREFMDALKQLDGDLAITGDKFATHLVKPLTDVVHWIDEVIQRFNQLGKGDTALDHMFQMLERWDKAHGGAPALIGTVAAGAVGAKVAAGASLAIAKGVFGGKSGAGKGGILGKLGAAAVYGALADLAVTAADPNDRAGSWIDANVPGAAWFDNQASRIGLGRSYAEQAIAASGNKAAYLMRRFQELGWSKAAAAGLVGNAAHETNGTLDPNTTNSIGMHGIFQWDHNRQKMLKEFAKKNGLNPDSLDAQIEFANWELNNTERGAGDKLKTTASYGDASDIVGSQFERYSSGLSAVKAAEVADQRRRFAGSAFDMPSTGGSITVSSNTTISVEAGKDARETADRVSSAQDRHAKTLASTLVRNSTAFGNFTPIPTGAN